MSMSVVQVAYVCSVFLSLGYCHLVVEGLLCIVRISFFFEKDVTWYCKGTMHVIAFL